jgi:hypothetical protein
MSRGIERIHPFSIYKKVMGQGTVSRDFWAKFIFPELVIGRRVSLYDSAVSDWCPAADTGGKLVICINGTDNRS